jgi:hypothetical protein
MRLINFKLLNLEIERQVKKYNINIVEYDVLENIQES